MKIKDQANNIYYSELLLNGNYRVTSDKFDATFTEAAYNILFEELKGK